MGVCEGAVAPPHPPPGRHTQTNIGIVSSMARLYHFTHEIMAHAHTSTTHKHNRSNEEVIVVKKGANIGLPHRRRVLSGWTRRW